MSAELVGMDYIQLKPIGCGKDLGSMILQRRRSRYNAKKECGSLNLTFVEIEKSPERIWIGHDWSENRVDMV